MVTDICFQLLSFAFGQGRFWKLVFCLAQNGTHLGGHLAMWHPWPSLKLWLWEGHVSR